MELGVQDGQDALTADRAAHTLDYWRTTAQQLLSDPEASGSPEALKSYSKLAVGQGNLLADRGYSAEAEQAYRIAYQICSYSVEAVENLSELLRRGGRADEARQLLDEFARK